MLTLYHYKIYIITSFFFFFFNDPAPTEIYLLPLHDALPISAGSSSPESRTCRAAACPDTRPIRRRRSRGRRRATSACSWRISRRARSRHAPPGTTCSSRGTRSEEHTSELQSQSNLGCRLLLE